MSNLCIAHRGWSGKAPENTLASFLLALELEHVNGIEIDVQLTRDGVPVVIHDFKLNRTTNGKGYVKDIDFVDLKALDAGSWFSPNYAYERVPSLEEVLKLVKGRCLLNIELKTAGGLYPQLEEKVSELLQAYQIEDQVFITSFDHTRVKRIKELNPRLKTGLIISGMPLLLKEQLSEAKAELISIHHGFIEESFVHEMLNHNFELMAWTVNDKKQIEQISRMSEKVTICTNHPDLMSK